MKYFLKAGGKHAKTNNELVRYVSDRFKDKQNIYEQRRTVLENLKEKVRFLLSVYWEMQGNTPKAPKSKDLYYKSVLCHQANNILMGSKLLPDFISYAPLGIEHDRSLVYKTDALTRAHKALRYQGLFNQAKQDAKKDLIWGNSFVEMVLGFEDERPESVEYQHVPFREMRNYYGQSDRMRIIEYTPEDYAGEYGEEELDDVSEGGIVEATDTLQSTQEQKLFSSPKGIIRVIRYYNPVRKIFAEIHGGNGKIYQNLEGDNYPLMAGKYGYDPFLESRFYEDPTADFFGWGVFDFLVDLANLDTTITNAVMSDEVWNASAPQILRTNDPDKLRGELRNWEKRRSKGESNKVMVEKDSGMGVTGGIIDLSKPSKMGLMSETDQMVVSRAVRGSNIDFNSLAEYAPTVGQQKLKKIEADKMNLRVLLLNEQREIEFAKKEMYFIKNQNTKFNNYEIEVEDEYAEKYKSPDGYKPMKKMKIKDILKGAENINMTISPRMDGALDDQSFLEIQEMQQDIGLLPQGTQAQIIALEKYIGKKNPTWNITRNDLITPAQPVGEPNEGEQQPGMVNPLEQQLMTA